MLSMTSACDEVTTGTGQEGTSHPDLLTSKGFKTSATSLLSASSAKSKKAKSQRRARKRVLFQHTNSGIQKSTKAIVMKRVSDVVKTNSVSLTDLATGEMRVAQGGWLGSRKPVGDGRHGMSLDNLLKHGYRLVEWDGV